MLTAISLAVEIFALANNSRGRESLAVAGVDDPGHLLGPRYPPASPIPVTARAQLAVRWRNWFSASAARKIGQAEIAAMMAKSSASTANSQLFSLAK
jgi:hypothetical protein